MNHGSLFSGIGGFDAAAEWIGWNNVFHCEINPFGRKILKYYWPNAISYDDITKTDFTIHRGNIDILTGGFPCQPFSLAGKRKGTEDPRNLWPEYYRAIREIQPAYVVGENVFGLVNWSEGLVFEQVQADLEAEGYEVAPVILPACSVNAPHKRERIWFVAYSESLRIDREAQYENSCEQGGEQRRCDIDNLSEIQRRNATPNTESEQSKRMQSEQREFSKQKQRQFRGISSEVGNRITPDTNLSGCRQSNEKMEGESSKQPNSICLQQNDANASNKRLQRSQFVRSIGEERQKPFNKQFIRSFRGKWEVFPTQSPVCYGDDGLSTRLDAITFPKWRNESIKAGGNAIVPQVVYQIFKAIEETHFNNLTQ